MRNIIAILTFSFPILIFGQNFKIKKPNIDELKAELQHNNFSDDAIYMFLKKQYDSIAEKKNVSHRRIFEETEICSFEQDFENGISYSMYNCSESGGMSISLMLPKTDRNSIIQWVELIYKSSPMDIEHGWNSEKTKFEPTYKGVGCYYEIKETESNTIVENYCGC